MYHKLYGLIAVIVAEAAFYIYPYLCNFSPTYYLKVFLCLNMPPPITNNPSHADLQPPGPHIRLLALA